MSKEGLGLEITELRLGLPGGGLSFPEKNEKKRGFSEIIAGDDESCAGVVGDLKSQMKNQVVGWPPVCSYRKKSFGEPKAYVKVSLDGAPFLRKIDLTMHKGYPDLALALQNLFSSYGIGEGLKDGDSCEFVPIYEDKDGDWMLVGDVPWEMFEESCKRLRIMKKSDAMGFGLQPKGFLIKGTSKDIHAETN